MNVYDFDGTIYNGDSTVDFWLYCLRKRPAACLKSMPAQLAGAVLYGLRRIPKEGWKERFFTFLKYTEADEGLIGQFWEEHSGKIKKWYLEQKTDSDLIISASPEFLLQPVCRKMGVSLIATQVDPATGRFRGKNCSGDEKVRRFRRQYPEGRIEQFYTDSRKDLPLAAIAERAYLVHGDTIQEMPKDAEGKR